MHQRVSRKYNNVDEFFLLGIKTNQRISIKRRTVEAAGCGYQTAYIGKQWRKLLYLCEDGVPIVVNAVIMAKWGIDTVLVGIAKLRFWLRLMRPGQQQQIVLWSGVRPPMATNAIDGHGEVMPCLCIHNRLRRLQKIVVAL